MALLANRRRHIIESRFKNHIKTIVELARHNTPAVSAKKEGDATTNITLHLNLSDLLHNTTENGSKGEAIQENKTKTNMPVIRNILFRRKMSFLNRKLPLDFDPDSYDTLALSELGKNGEDILVDAEDSLQVEESSHDKLIYYDVKNNSTKQTMNNFDDTSEETKAISMHNKSKIIPPDDTSTKTKLDNNETTSKKVANNKDNKTDYRGSKNNTHFIPQSVFNHFRPPEDVPLEEMQPFLHFGDKLPTAKQNLTRNQSTRTPPKEKLFIDDNVPQKNEDEVDEHMDVAVTKAAFENKIPKLAIPSQKVTVVQQYMKNRSYNISKSLAEKNNTKTTKNDRILNIPRLRNSSRNRGFRNRTIFFHQKRNGLRQTINLRPNSTIADLRPPAQKSENGEENLNASVRDEDNETISRNVTKNLEKYTTKALPLRVINLENTTLDIRRDLATEATKIFSTKQVSGSNGAEVTTKIVPTVITPSSKILSTDVVTSISISSSISEHNKTKSKTLGLIPSDSEATVISQLNNFTSQSFNKDIADKKAVPKLRNTSEAEKPIPVFYLNKTDFIIHVPDSEMTTLNSARNTYFVPETDATQTEMEVVTKPLENNIKDVSKKDITQMTSTVKSTRVNATTATTQAEITTKSTKNIKFLNIFNNTNSELPLATLFSVIDIKKSEPDPAFNTTKIIATETVISRKKQNEASFDNVHAAYILACLGLIPMFIIMIYIVRNFMQRKNKCFEEFDTEMHDDKTNFITPVARLPSLLTDPPSLPASKWEFPRSKLRLQTLLGQGNFGQVCYFILPNFIMFDSC